MFEDLLSVQQALIAIGFGYFLGSIPFAYLGARYRGVDIFSTGTKTAGAANVFWNIGRGTGVGVFVGDVAKGAAAVMIAGLVDGSWPVGLLAGSASVLGHWKSVFARFRGGDGMATLMGATVVLAPALAILGIAAGLVTVLLLRRSRLRSPWGLSVCFASMLGLSLLYQVDLILAMGLAALASLVLFRSLASQRHRGPAALEDGDSKSTRPSPIALK